MAQSTKQGEISSEIFKATQDIAAQAALRAQERLQKVREPPMSSDVPEIPARTSGVFQKAPDIPPKKASLKQAQDSAGIKFAGNNVPPPLPQKPQARSDNPINNGVYAQTAAFGDIPQRKDYLPQVPMRNPNGGMPLPVKNGNTNGQLELKPNKQMTNKLAQLSPTEDTSSEDALRGIESGLRNMERAMQEQLTLRSMEVDAPNFSVPEFRSGLRNMGSLSSFEGLTPPQYVMDSYRKVPENVNGSGRSVGLERGISMDQMKQDSGRPIEQHMRSLDRNLPLELQYSRNHRQHMQNQQQQQQLFLQQQLVTKVMNAADPNRHMDMYNQFMNRPSAPLISNNAAGQVPNVGRDDLKLRRRSSHDENQILQTTAQGPGTNAIF